MNREEIRYYEDKCIQNELPGCAARCPLHLDVRALMGAVAAGRFREGARLLQKSIPFPFLIAHLCSAPCRHDCGRQDLGGSLDIGAIERAALAFGQSGSRVLRRVAQREERVAILGNDLTGLTAAAFLYEKGYQVYYYETGPMLGSGLWQSLGINGLTERDIMADLEPLSASGITVEYNSKAIPSCLREEGFPKVYDSIAAGEALDCINKVFRGRSDAITMDREMKNVSLTDGRENEGPYKSRLIVNHSGAKKRAPIERREPDYNREEAMAEAKRCLRCQCMICVDQCAFLAKYEGYPKQYIREIANNVNMTLGVRQTKNLVNSCTFCGLCGEICPNGLNMAEFCLSSKEQLFAKGAMPETIHDFPLRDMAYSNGPECALFLPEPGKEESRYLFFPGCQMAALRPILVEKAYDFLLGKLEGGVGLALGCCGAPAHWAGRRDAHTNVKERFLRQWQEMEKPTIIVACPTCQQIFREDFPEATILSLWSIYEEHGGEGFPYYKDKELSLHDACTARHQNEVQRAVRHVARRCGVAIKEIPFHGEQAKCCGFGGLVPFANPEVAREMTALRAGESDKEYLVYCVMCQERFRMVGKNAYHLLDLLYPDVLPPADSTFSQRRQNRKKLKEKLLCERWEKTDGQEHDEMELLISEEMGHVLDSRLILLDDIRRVIETAEKSGQKILHPRNGHMTAGLQMGLITYWVEYSVKDTAFQVHKAYSHRLELNKDIKENEHRKYSI